MKQQKIDRNNVLFYKEIIEEYNGLNEYQKSNMPNPFLEENQTNGQLILIREILNDINRENIKRMLDPIYKSVFLWVASSLCLAITAQIAGIISPVVFGAWMFSTPFLLIGLDSLIDYLVDYENDKSSIANLARDMNSKNIITRIREITLVVLFMSFMITGLIIPIILVIKFGNIGLFFTGLAGPISSLLACSTGVICYRSYYAKDHLEVSTPKNTDSSVRLQDDQAGNDQPFGIRPIYDNLDNRQFITEHQSKL